VWSRLRGSQICREWLRLLRSRPSSLPCRVSMRWFRKAQGVTVDAVWCGKGRVLCKRCWARPRVRERERTGGRPAFESCAPIPDRLQSSHPNFKCNAGDAALPLRQLEGFSIHAPRSEARLVQLEDLQSVQPRAVATGTLLDASGAATRQMSLTTGPIHDWCLDLTGPSPGVWIVTEAAWCASFRLGCWGWGERWS